MRPRNRIVGLRDYDAALRKYLGFSRKEAYLLAKGGWALLESARRELEMAPTLSSSGASRDQTPGL